MPTVRGLLAVALSALLLAPPLDAAAQRRERKVNQWTRGEPIQIPSKEECGVLPAAGPVPWQAGETLSYDVDVLGANAGKMRLIALPTVGKGGSAELPLRALAASNSFFSKIRRVRGRSTSYVRAKDLHPRRYREDTNEGGVVKWAEVVFKKPKDGGIVQIDWQRNKAKGKRNIRYGNEIFDPVSAAYYLRAMPLAAGQKVCFDAYGIRQVWRVFGSVQGVESVTVPAGSFEAFHVVGKAVRLDNPRSHREIHLWISNDARRLPLAALGVIDLGPVRAQLTAIGVSAGDDSEDKLDADSPKNAGKGGKAVGDDDDEDDEDEETPVVPSIAPGSPAKAAPAGAAPAAPATPATTAPESAPASGASGGAVATPPGTGAAPGTP